MAACELLGSFGNLLLSYRYVNLLLLDIVEAHVFDDALKQRNVQTHRRAIYFRTSCL